MSKILIPIIFVITAFFISCEKNIMDPYDLSDAQIIEMIIESNKIEILIEEMPENSQVVVNQEYSDYMEISLKKANDFGYEVELAGIGHRSGHRNEVYFNLKGRKLDPNDWGKKTGWDKSRLDKSDKEDWKCFELIFPVAYNMPDGTTIVVFNDDESEWSIMKTWYEANSEYEEKAELQFPVVIFLEEELITLNNYQELRDAYVACNDSQPNRERDKRTTCFELVYPISYTMPDETTISIDNVEDYMNIRNWYLEYPDVEEKPSMEYPVSISYYTEVQDSIVIIESEEDMFKRKVQCWESEIEDIEYENEKCYTFIYPISFLMPDGSNIVVDNDEEQGWHELSNWYESNSEYEEEPILNYPIDIVIHNQEGIDQLTINNDEDLESAEEYCKD